MSNIVREDLDALNATLTVTIEQADYLDSYGKQLSKYRKEAQIKGFRIGKTPLQVIKKMFGRPVLIDLVNQEIEKTLNGYLKDSNVNIIGQPIPADDQEDANFDPKDPQDFTFKYEIGLIPEFEVLGLDSATVYETYAPIIPEEMVEEEWTKLLKSSEDRVDGEQVEAGDLIRFMALEMDGEEVKEDGLDAEFSLLFNDTSEEVQAMLLGKEVGDAIVIPNIYEIDSNLADERSVRKYLLHLGDDEPQDFNQSFQLNIREIKRVKPAVIDQNFFDQYLGEGVASDEMEAKAFIRNSIAKQYEQQSDTVLFYDVRNRLLELNNFSLPDDFIKRWLGYSNEDSTPEQIEAGYENLSKSIRWSIISNKLNAQFENTVTDEDLKASFRKDIANMYGAYGASWMTEDILNMLTERMLKDEKAVEKKFYEVLADKLLDSFKGILTVQTHSIALSEFTDKMKEIFNKLEDEGDDTQALLDFDEEE